MKENNSIYQDGSYLDNNNNWHEEDAPFKVSSLEKMIKRNGIHFINCADIGCGSGLITQMLASKYSEADFYGFDITEDVEGFWNNRAVLPNLKFINNNFNNETGLYDLVICLDVFEHVEDYFGFLRSLKSKGKQFIFNIPLDMNVFKIITPGIKYAREEVGHIHYFNKYTAIKTLEDCGYVIKDSFLSVPFIKILPRNIRQLAILPFRLLSLLLGKSFSCKLFGGMSLVVLVEKN